MEHTVSLAEMSRPLLLNPADAAEWDKIAELVRSSEAVFVHDTLREQLAELEEGRVPHLLLSPEELDERVSEHLDGRQIDRYGNWAFYPWSRRLVHVLPIEEHRELRTDRNRYKLTAEEQAILADARVGVIGLSVGNMAAITCTLEGIGSSFKLADFDRLSLSNLNRLRGGVHDIGVPKTTLVAREMFEIDPYLDVTLVPEGVTEDNLDAFLVEGGALDILIEECDDLFIKIVVRERARLHGIPVIMDTSDRGMLDVERFDLEPNRPILHGLVGDLDARTLKGLETKDKVPFFMSIVDADRMSTRMAASLFEIDETVSSWPQLASSVALGGALAADTARRILLGELTDSGRYYVDVDEIVRDGAGRFTECVSPPAEEPITPEALREPDLPSRPDAASPNGPPTPEALRWIAAHALLAPSAHNTQPWKLHWCAANNVLELLHDATHALPAFDFEHNATWVGFGALLENLEMAARAIGLASDVETFSARSASREAVNAGGADDSNRGAVVAEVRFKAADPADDPLLPWVTRRVSNRRREAQTAQLDAEALDAMHAEAEACGGRLEIRQDPAALDEMADLLGAVERITVLNRDIHEDFFSGFRWTQTEVAETRDGLDLATLELEASERAGLQILRQWRVMGEHSRIGAPGRALEDLARECVEASAAIGVVSVEGTDPRAHLRGGRAVQRMWLAAAAHGVALQPMTSLPYYLARFERGGADLFTDAQRRELAEVAVRFGRIFERAPDRAEVFLFRAARASPPTARSLRRHMSDMVTGI